MANVENSSFIQRNGAAAAVGAGSGVLGALLTALALGPQIHKLSQAASAAVAARFPAVAGRINSYGPTTLQALAYLAETGTITLSTFLLAKKILAPQEDVIEEEHVALKRLTAEIEADLVAAAKRGDWDAALNGGKGAYKPLEGAGVDDQAKAADLKTQTDRALAELKHALGLVDNQPYAADQAHEHAPAAVTSVLGLSQDVDGRKVLLKLLNLAPEAAAVNKPADRSADAPHVRPEATDAAVDAAQEQDAIDAMPETNDAERQAKGDAQVLRDLKVAKDADAATYAAPRGEREAYNRERDLEVAAKAAWDAQPTAVAAWQTQEDARKAQLEANDAAIIELALRFLATAHLASKQATVDAANAP